MGPTLVFMLLGINSTTCAMFTRETAPAKLHTAYDSHIDTMGHLPSTTTV